MPELPEVETLARSLRSKLIGLGFTGVEVTMEKIIKEPESSTGFAQLLVGKRILEIERRGKYLLCALSDDYVLLFHLRMTGSLVYGQGDLTMPKHTHVIFCLDNGSRLRYTDTRQFGRIWLLPTERLATLAGFKDLGVEPLSSAFTAQCLAEKLSGQRGRIKPLLLNQACIAGLGNIYVDEALYRAGINPEVSASTLSAQQISLLRESIQRVLSEGIANRGTTVRDYLDGDGIPGTYQNLLRVYGKEGQPCPTCSAPIVRKKVGGRSSFFCPHCQPTPTSLKIIGLTGNIGCGKSMVSSYLAEKGALIIDADQVARDIVRQGTPALAEIAAHFGSGVLDPTGNLDRKKLGALVFSDPAALAKLNSITHPRIIEAIEKEKTKLAAKMKTQGGLLVIDAPLLIETGLHHNLDEIWMVTLDPQVQIQRLMTRDGISESEARQRIESQMPQAEKMKFAHRIIDNNGTPEETKEQITKNN